MEQRTDEWFAARLGKVTGSRIADVTAKIKSGYAAARKNYMSQLLCERLTGVHESIFVNAAVQRGIDLEPKARSNYILLTGELVEEVGFINHPTIQMSGASPDGLVGHDGLLEIKCPNTSTHLDFIRTKKPKSEYMLQMQWQMVCTGRKWCDFVSYDDRLPKNLAFSSVRIFRDDEKIIELEAEVNKFLGELDELAKSVLLMAA
ncbi:lambda exonuclease family protein [Snodgrassella sp. B3088]|uniref:lambda exonuclease family protein n=1 Tax=Snodgrassella TaxID=1193515 RepID=UPI0022698052|nr:lambda exonuclease family protein [Snodgrassella sp. B3088]MCX8748390.1 YqaJ viral recombinase family protein [Snodgrassella sp. B3088]